MTRHGGWSWGGQRPPWWPENEPFPPRGRWGAPPSREFMRRAAGFFALVAILSIGAATFLFWTLASALGSSSDTGVNVARGAAILFLLLVVFVSTRSARRLARRVGDVIDAVGRVAEGDLTTRVAERGPRYARSLARAFNTMTSRLEAAEDQRRRLLADVSHELRTPLSVVQGGLEAMVDGVHPADAQHLQAILDETKILARLVEDLRTLSLAESGALALHREPTDIGAIAEETIGSFARQAEESGVTLRTVLAPGLPLIDADPVRAREILGNLISNAIRYTPSGGSVRVETARSDGAVAVTIQDTGAGIAPEVLDRVFDRFYKSPESRGAGLGLAIAKQLVEAHGGAISATSVVGQGTTMRFTLPAEAP